MKLYEDQEKIVHDVREAYKQGIRRPIIQAPTGFGKTHVSHEILSLAVKKGKKTLFLCDRIALCEQTAQAFHKLGSRVGIIQQGYRGDTNPEILIASVQSIEKAPRLPEVDIIFRDEAHVMREYDKTIMTKYDNVLFVGMSATPWSRGLGAPGYYQKIIEGPSVQELIDRKRLTESEIWAPSKPDLEKVGIIGGEYNQKELGKVTAKRVGEVVDQWFKHGSGQQTMISAVNCADSIAITDKLQERGVNAVHVDYKTKVDEMYKEGGIIDQFKTEQIQILSSVFKLSIGIDLPNCTCLVFAAPTKSLIRHIQFWGRGIRAFSGKKYTTVIDMVGSIDALGKNTEPFPNILDNGEKPPAQSTEYEKREKKYCTAVMEGGKVCGADKKGSRTCPVCGFTPTPLSNVEKINGELVRISREPTKDEKLMWWRMFKGYAAKKKYSKGWTWYKYKEKFGVHPANSFQGSPLEPNQEVSNFIKHLEIKYHYKTKKKSLSG